MFSLDNFERTINILIGVGAALGVVYTFYKFFIQKFIKPFISTLKKANNSLELVDILKSQFLPNRWIFYC